MLEALINLSVERRFLILALVMFLIGFGLWSWTELPIDSYPDLTNKQVNVITEAPGMAAAEVEELVTYPIESAIMGLPATEEVRSISKFGLSIVTIVFADSMDLLIARQRVNERLQEMRGGLPEGVEPVLGPLATAFGEIYQYVIEGEGYEAMELKTLHDWNVRYQLRTVPGVTEVNSWGGFIRQYQVKVDPERLQAHDLMLGDVFRALAESNANFGGSYIEHGSEAYTVRGLGRFRSEQDIREVMVRSERGIPVRVADLASVGIGAAPRHGAVTKDGQGEVVSGMVIMTQGENSKRVIQRVKKRVEEVENTLPEGVRLTAFYDQTDLVDRTTRTVATNLMGGGLLVIIVLFLFLHSVPAAVVVALVIPLSMLVAFAGMRLFGVSANLMSLGAIDFGLVVDGGVVMMENVLRRLRANAGKAAEGASEPAREVVRQSALQVARPVLFGMAIIIAVYIPIFSLEGMAARMFYPMALTVSMAIFGALVLALTFVPAAATVVAQFSVRPAREPMFDRLRAAYRHLLIRALRHRRITFALAVLIVAGALASVPFLGTEFMPELDEGAILIEARRLPSVSLTESVEISTRIEKTLMEFPEVESVVSKMGRPDLATEAMGIYLGDVYVILKPRREWITAGNRDDLIDAMASRLEHVPGVAFSFTQPLAMRLDEVIFGIRADVAVKLFGDDPEVLRREAERIRRVLAGIPGAADVQVETMGGAAELHIELKREEMARYGLRVADVSEVVETALGGKVATQVIDGRRRFDVVARLPQSHTGSSDALRTLLIRAPGGERVPLGTIARVGLAEGPEVIHREDAQRRLVIRFNLRGRDSGSFVAEAQAAVAREIRLPVGYYLTWGGDFQDRQRAMERLYLVVPVMMFSVFVLLYWALGSVPLATLILLNLPFALVGGIGALWLRDLNLSLSASIGFIALLGIAVTDGLVMVTYIKQLRERGKSLHEAVVEGATVRLRPVLITSFVATLGFLPMALSTSPGAEVQRPLASVVIGGLVTATLLTLVVLPTLYHWMERRRQSGRLTSPL